MPYQYLALLRGVNVGGKNQLPMKDVARMFVEAGCSAVQTYIQSGNILFNAPAKTARRIPMILPEQIDERFGHRPPLVVRTTGQLAAVVAENPFPQVSEDALHVMFLSEPSGPARVKELDPARSSPDAFLVRGSEIYLWLPNGSARTKLSNAYFDSKLSNISTSRNWRTVTRLLQMMR